MTSYNPISCDQHSQYELAIIRAQDLEINWRDEAGILQHDTVKPIDLITENHAEFLIAIRNKDRIKIRLDYIE